MYYKTPTAQFEFSAEEFDELCYAAREAEIRWTRLRKAVRRGDSDVGHHTEESCNEKIAFYKKMEADLRDRFDAAFGTDYNVNNYECWDDVVAEEGATYVVASETATVETEAMCKGETCKYIWKATLEELVVYYAGLYGPDSVIAVTYEVIAPEDLASVMEANRFYEVLNIADCVEED